MDIDELDLFEDPFAQKFEEQANKREAKMRRHFKRDNMELVDGAVKGGFLSQVCGESLPPYRMDMYMYET